MNKNLCQAVDCLSISDHVLKCVINVNGKEEIHSVRMCHDHYLQQKALEYHKENRNE